MLWISSNRQIITQGKYRIYIFHPKNTTLMDSDRSFFNTYIEKCKEERKHVENDMNKLTLNL